MLMQRGKYECEKLASVKYLLNPPLESTERFVGGLPVQVNDSISNRLAVFIIIVTDLRYRASKHAYPSPHRSRRLCEHHLLSYKCCLFKWGMSYIFWAAVPCS